jgi:hypothetical protein
MDLGQNGVWLASPPQRQQGNGEDVNHLHPPSPVAAKHAQLLQVQKGSGRPLEDGECDQQHTRRAATLQ